MAHDLMVGPIFFMNRSTSTSSYVKNTDGDNSCHGLRRPLVQEDSDYSDDDEKPLASRMKKVHGERNSKLKRIKQVDKRDDDSSPEDDRQTLATRFPNLSSHPALGRRGSNPNSDSEEDRLSLADRLSRVAARVVSSSESFPNPFLISAAPPNKKAKVPSDECPKSKPAATAKNVLRSMVSNKDKERTKIKTAKGTVGKSQLSKTMEFRRRGPTGGNRKSKPPAKNIVNKKSQGFGAGKKWSTLEHNGVIFPPPYKPHGVKMLYNGGPVDLTPEQEEVATMFAAIKDTEDASKETFISNFFADWRKILGTTHIISKFEFCDFTPIYEWQLRESEKKKQMSSKEKKAQRENKFKQEEKFMWATVDGVKEKVGNFRLEPPTLFRGRGEHPKTGSLKRRIQPSDVTINIGKGSPVPVCPIPGERWKEVKHDNTVTWLACWDDPISQGDTKYVFLAPSSSLKGNGDKEKYEKARKLKDHIENIRLNYTRDFRSKDRTKKEIAVATYLIDKLALRAGNEKGKEEADTVGCCTLKVGNVICVPPNKLQFDFLGKDSVRYLNTVEVELPIYKAIEEFRAGKNEGACVFDKLNTAKLNAHLKELMHGLSAKVFRTYNASITLDTILNKETEDGALLKEKLRIYRRANKEVAVICNHQRAISKLHDSQMTKLSKDIDELKAKRDALKADLEKVKKGIPQLVKTNKRKPLGDGDEDVKQNKRKRYLMTPEVLENKITRIETKIEEKEMHKKEKEDSKTIALGTSKINYLDPRITVAWCHTHQVPIGKIFSKAQQARFGWAMDVEPDFRF